MFSIVLVVTVKFELAFFNVVGGTVTIGWVSMLGSSELASASGTGVSFVSIGFSRQSNASWIKLLIPKIHSSSVPFFGSSDFVLLVRTMTKAINSAFNGVTKLVNCA